MPVSLLITATCGADEAQVTRPVTSLVVLSLYVAIAVNCCVVPSAIEGFAGLIAIETGTADVTVKLALALTEAMLAVMLTDPAATPLATPWLPVLLLIVAMVKSDVLHCTVEVTSCVLPSLKVPLAVNACVVPAGMEPDCGAMEMLTGIAAVTVSVAGTVIPENDAVIPTVPVPEPVLVATPELLIVAISVLADTHVADFVRSCVLLSLYVPVAVKAWDCPKAIVGFAGLIVIETNCTGCTVKVVNPLTAPKVAVIVVLPGAIVAATPA